LTARYFAAFHVDHPHDQPSFDLFVRCKKTNACCAVHSLAEVYATLTGMPAPPRASGDQALLFIGNIRERFTLVALDAQEYAQMLEMTAAAAFSEAPCMTRSSGIAG
jgi:hypothetical protein